MTLLPRLRLRQPLLRAPSGIRLFRNYSRVQPSLQRTNSYSNSSRVQPSLRRTNSCRSSSSAFVSNYFSCRPKLTTLTSDISNCLRLLFLAQKCPPRIQTREGGDTARVLIWRLRSTEGEPVAALSWQVNHEEPFSGSYYQLYIIERERIMDSKLTKYAVVGQSR